jgi:hypothetical protein
MLFTVLRASPNGKRRRCHLRAGNVEEVIPAE